MAAAQARQRQHPATTATTTMTRAQRNRVPRPTPDEVALLKRHYDGRGKHTIALAMHMHVSRPTIARWAKKLGLTQPRQPRKRWTLDEISTLDGSFSTSSVAKLATQLDRTPHAIRHKAHQLRLTKIADDYTAASLAKALGCDPHRVTLFVRRGWLPGDLRETDRTLEQGHVWRFTNRDVARLFVGHAAEMWPHGMTAEQAIWLASVMAQGGK